jgi:hypothetical protein
MITTWATAQKLTKKKQWLTCHQKKPLLYGNPTSYPLYFHSKTNQLIFFNKKHQIPFKKDINHFIYLFIYLYK